MRTLILLDLQNDYGAFGAVPIPDAEAIIAIANELIDQFPIVVATQDWHPASHISFAANHPWRHPGQVIEIDGSEQELSIIHCVQNSFGAEFMNGLNTEKINTIIHKGTDPKIASYSGFFDKNRQRDTGLNEWLKAKGVTEVVILGLEQNDCVHSTAKDAIELGFKTSIIKDSVELIQQNNQK